ncbi:hypothetical protein Tco_1323994, partial [Tanacetum coccineum]
VDITFKYRTFSDGSNAQTNCLRDKWPDIQTVTARYTSQKILNQRTVILVKDPTDLDIGNAVICTCCVADPCEDGQFQVRQKTDVEVDECLSEMQEDAEYIYVKQKIAV